LNIKGKLQFVTIQRTPGPRTGNVRMPALDCSNVMKYYTVSTTLHTIF